MYIPSFTDLVGDESVFAAEYFDRRPLLRRGALSGPSCTELLAVADLDDLLNSEIVRPPYIRLSAQGRDVPVDNYTRSMNVQGKDIGGYVDPKKVLRFFRTGATITWNSLGHTRPNLRAFIAVLADRFATLCDLNAILTPAGQQGFLPHHDPVDVFVVQLHGTKSWRVWPRPQTPHRDVAHYTPEKLGEPLLAASVRPGDVIYLPHGAPHAAVAEDSMSLHLSIMITPQRWSDLVLQTARSIMDSNPDFHITPYLNSANREQLTHDLAARLEILYTELRSRETGQIVDDLITASKEAVDSTVTRPFADLADAEGLSDNSIVSRHPGNAVSVEVASTNNEKSVVFVDGNRYAMPVQVAIRLAELTPGTEIKAGDFLGSGTEISLRTVRTLARIGAVHVRHDSR
ncbi:cupin domain-containing protein [Nocardia sp. NPDC051990]|uniref:JmjC domain-containing protein n=1 Tax=Nocardia sp. NPDC051990 TaxID=3155285 RepID=UPI003434C75D